MYSLLLLLLVTVTPVYLLLLSTGILGDLRVAGGWWLLGCKGARV